MQIKASWAEYFTPTCIPMCNPGGEILNGEFFLDSVTQESLYGVTTTIHEVQAVLLSMIHKDTILVGHSLESDLKATKVSFQGTI